MKAGGLFAGRESAEYGRFWHVKLWDAYTSRLVAKMTLTETNRITGLAFTPDGLELAATRVVGTVEVCSVQGKEQTM